MSIVFRQDGWATFRKAVETIMENTAWVHLHFTPRGVWLEAMDALQICLQHTELDIDKCFFKYDMDQQAGLHFHVDVGQLHGFNRKHKEVRGMYVGRSGGKYLLRSPTGKNFPLEGDDYGEPTLPQTIPLRSLPHRPSFKILLPELQNMVLDMCAGMSQVSFLYRKNGTACIHSTFENGTMTFDLQPGDMLVDCKKPSRDVQSAFFICKFLKMLCSWNHNDYIKVHMAEDRCIFSCQGETQNTYMMMSAYKGPRGHDVGPGYVSIALQAQS